MKVTLEKLILLTILLLFYSKTFSQNNDFEIPIRKNAISFSILGITPAIGFVYERVLSNNVSAELGVGFASLGAGIMFYPNGMKMNKLIFHTGFMASASPWFNSGEMTFEGQGFVSYIPLGISYFGKNKLNFGIDLGPGTSYFNLEKILLYGNIKIGVRF